MTITLTEYANLRRLVTAANDEIWWEDDVAAGGMTELNTTGNAIDTTDQLNMFEAYQKAIIVNGAKLKIVDFGNIKIVDANTFTNKPTRGQRVYQNGSDPAVMVVDFINGDDDTMYGYVISGTFEVTTAIRTAAGGGGTIIFPSPEAPVTGPHWYDYTVYNNDTDTYGTMPDKAYLGCLYNGRVVLSGNPAEPNQWYMSRQNNMFDWAYVANDSQSPVKGSQGDLGEVGDIVRSLAPYKDDYLNIGCASSMFIIFGDPMYGGELRELSLTTGIFGAKSYCWDNNNNFYFWGNNGLYKTQIPGNPQCISQFKLPRIVKDEAASPATHRITLLYDNDRHGILVAITVLATGVNSNYWYDLNGLDEQETGGFFPESYPTACGIYSGIYYESNTASLKGLVLGCTDGYIRTFDDTVKSDVVGGQSNAINSYVNIGPIPMSNVPLREGTLSGIDLTVAGVQPSGDSDDSNDVDFKVYTARTSEKVLKRMSVNTNPDFAGTFAGPGNVRGTTRRQTVRNSSLGLRLQNTTVDESWGFEDLYIHLKDSGRKK